MEEEEVGIEQTLTLFDLYWFRHHVLLSPPPPPPPQPTTTLAVAAVLDIEEDARSNASEPPPASSPRRPIARHRRTLSDERGPFVSDTGLERSRLETILSGKESAAAEIGAAAAERGRHRRRRWRRRRGASSATTTTSTRSLSDLEFEELKGLMDLGFTFSEAEAAADPRLAEIVPALRRRSMAAESTSPPTAESGDDAAGVARPYLSEAWDEAEEKEEEEEEGEGEERGSVLRNWRIPVYGDEVDLKENLRLWAHTVASTVL
ncbi:hypothetical protein ACMD2_25453 [Ananas comosus]|uniref:Uncharacterized protein n=1 Tax=Ananas comosus TaxID=4615 RepID=A0A199V7Z4_ANACO|nr:hypothetical protein ACMD2_25453 [Ananas comosus]